MKVLLMTISLMSCLSLGLSSPSQEFIISKQAPKINEYRLMLKNSDFNQRRKAVKYFSLLPINEIGENLMNELIDYIAEETGRFKEANKSAGVDIYTPPYNLFPNSDGEAYLNYLEDLCKIAGASGNNKGLSFLIEYYAAPFHLIAFGEEAVDPYLEALNKPTNTVDMKICHMRALGYWLQDKEVGYNASGETRDKIKNELIKQAFSKEYPARVSALINLSRVKDEDLFPIFEKIAANDPGHSIEGINGISDKPLPLGKKALRYPLREMARMELEKRRKK